MASTTGKEEAASSSMEANGAAVAMDAKLTVATNVQQLKDLLDKESSSAIMLVMASRNQAPVPKPSLAVMNPLLLASACRGSWQELEFLLSKADGQTHPTVQEQPTQEFLELLATYMSGNSTDGSLAGDVEAFLTESLLEGVTIEGDTALHAVVTHGDSDDFLRSAGIIYNKAKQLLFVQNSKGETPLHCAVQAGKSRMVSYLIGLARGDDTVEGLLKMENNLKETVLHEAVRNGNSATVELLMEENSELASFPKDGPSPMYLAILLENKAIAETLYKESGGILSYSGPNGQNALHAAALRGPVLTGKLLEWKRSLSTQNDESGSTPLHFAAAVAQYGVLERSFLYLHGSNPTALHKWIKRLLVLVAALLQLQLGNVCWRVLEANPAALYQPDNNGSFPIHVAASVGATQTVAMFVNKYPSSAGLRDTNGRTFLHVAVERKMIRIVYYASKKELSWILNMRDKDGNTALHLAVQGGSLRIFCALFYNWQVQLNLTNEKGQTPLDISRYKVPPGIFYNQNSENYICYYLARVGARSGALRKDHFEDSYKDTHQQKPEDNSKEIGDVKDTAQYLSIGSVVMATVTFSASLALPGGYRADDHPNGGTPTLGGRYAFDAFMIANTLAFICSLMATFGLMISGSSVVSLVTRKYYLNISTYFISTSITSLAAAFALGAYLVLSPIAYNTAIAICVLSSLIVVSTSIEMLVKHAFIMPAFYIRAGLISTLERIWSFVGGMLCVHWPIIFSFGWAIYGSKHSSPTKQPPAQPPTPLG